MEVKEKLKLEDRVSCSRCRWDGLISGMRIQATTCSELEVRVCPVCGQPLACKDSEGDSYEIFEEKATMASSIVKPGMLVECKCGWMGLPKQCEAKPQGCFEAHVFLSCPKCKTILLFRKTEEEGVYEIHKQENVVSVF
ncbi:MAG: hypothetical protein PHN74_03295 [Candidatus Pacebacteria bacterium]|nr:hypothetical protein [Candidatus Paceibacterota bacterium]